MNRMTCVPGSPLAPCLAVYHGSPYRVDHAIGSAVVCRSGASFSCSSDPTMSFSVEPGNQTPPAPLRGLHPVLNDATPSLRKDYGRASRREPFGADCPAGYVPARCAGELPRRCGPCGIRTRVLPAENRTSSSTRPRGRAAPPGSRSFPRSPGRTSAPPRDAANLVDVPAQNPQAPAPSG